MDAAVAHAAGDGPSQSRAIASLPPDGAAPSLPDGAAPSLPSDGAAPSLLPAGAAPPGPGRPTVTISAGSVVEGDDGSAVLSFPVALSVPAPHPVVVLYRTRDGTATAGSDYRRRAGVLVLPAGQVADAVEVAVIGDVLVEGDETLSVDVLAPVNGLGAAPGSAAGTIIDDDGPDMLADLSVSKRASAASVAAGQVLTYTVTVRNDGPTDATDVVSTDVLPSAVAFASTSGCAEDPAGIPACSLGTIAAGTAKSYELRAFVSPSTSAERMTNAVTVTSVTPDPDPDDNSAAATTTVTRSADLSLTKTDDLDPVARGETVVYTVDVSNAGPSDATGVVSTDMLPAGMTLVSTSGCAEDPAAVPACTLGTIAAGRTASYTVTVAVDAAASGTLTNSASVTSSTPDPDPSNDGATETTLVATGALLAVTVSGPPEAYWRQTHTYEITVTNRGPMDAMNVEVAFTRDPSTPFVSTSGCNNDPSGIPNCELGIVAAGHHTSFTVTVAIPHGAPSPIMATATVSSSTPDPDASDDTDTESTDTLDSPF